MLNCFNIYAIVWTIVLVLYDLRWSDYCQPLNIWLRLFIYFSIISSIVLGQIFKDRLRYKKLPCRLDISNVGTIVLCILQLLEYFYCKEIPLFNVIMKKGSYSDFGGIPTVHVFIYTFSTFYSQLLFYAFLIEKKRRYLRNYCLLLFVVFGLQFMRGGLIICLGSSALMLISSKSGKIRLRHIFLAVLGLLLAAYLFGGFGNIRQGYAWNDSSAFLRFGKINDNFPSWLPHQFAWVYSYVVGSLATLNANILARNISPSIFALLQSVVPDFISRRIWGSAIKATPILIWKGFTTTTGYFDAYYYGGILGIYLMFFILTTIALLITNLIKVKDKYKVLVMANMSIILSLYFFTNALHNSAISFSVVYPIIFSLFNERIVVSITSKKIKIKSIQLRIRNEKKSFSSNN